MTTTVAVGSVSVTTSGALTNQLLQNLASALSITSSQTISSLAAGTSIPAASAPGIQLFISDSVTGTISVGGGYQAIMYNGTGTVVGGDSSTAIIGDLNYTGPAGTVVSTGTVGGNVSDSTASAVMSFAGGPNAVTASGTGQTVYLDAGTNMIDALAASQMFVQGGGSSTVNSSGATSGSSTAMASGGNLTFFAFGTGNDVVSVSGASTTLQFLGIGGIDTITGGAGADTVFAGQALYMGGTGSNLFVGGAGMSTLMGASKETIYSGSGGGIWSLASNSSNFFDAAGSSVSSVMAADTVMLATGSSTAQIWSANNEKLMIGAASGGSGAVVVAYGNNQSIDMTNAAGNDSVIMWNVNLSSTQAFTGNMTLTASDAGHDAVVMFGSLGGMASEGAHTITINNWQASDILDLSQGYTAADAQTATTALATGSSFTLADGTTVQFVGAKPTTVIHN